MWTYFEFASQMTKPFSLLYFVRFGWKKTKVLKWNRTDGTPGFRFGGSFLVKLMSAHSREGTAYSILVNKILFSFFCYLAKQNWIRNSGRWIRLLHKFRHTLLIVGSFLSLFVENVVFPVFLEWQPRTQNSDMDTWVILKQ